MLQMFAFSAASVGKLREMQNGGKRARRGLDAWDQVSGQTSAGSQTGTNGLPAK
jgi:hypothetical protein